LASSSFAFSKFIMFLLSPRSKRADHFLYKPEML